MAQFIRLMGKAYVGLSVAPKQNGVSLNVGLIAGLTTEHPGQHLTWHNTGLPEAFQMGVGVMQLTLFICKAGKVYAGPPTTPRQDPTSSNVGLVTRLTAELR